MGIDINFSSLGQDMQSEEDSVLKELREAADPIIAKIDADPMAERAVFMVGAKDITDDSGESVGIQTFIDVAGDTGLVQEALYTELVDQIDIGNPELFEAIRAVIRQIEEEKELEPGDSLQIPESRTLH